MDVDEALARRLQQEEQEELARCARDADFARALLAQQLLGLPSPLVVKKEKPKNKKKTAASRPWPSPHTPYVIGATPAEHRPGINTGAKRAARRKPAASTDVALAMPKAKVPVKEDRRVEHLMKCLHELVAAHPACKPELRSERHREYQPVELFEAMRWILGSEPLSDVPPPVLETNCQRVVEVWRVFKPYAADAAATAADQAQADERLRRNVAAEAMIDGFRAWLGEHERRVTSVWERLPLEVMEMIFGWLPPDEPEHLLRARQVCRAWFRVTSATNQPFWRRLLLAHQEPIDRVRCLLKEARRQEHSRFLKIARREERRESNRGYDDEDNEEDDDDENCWRRRYYELLHGFDMGRWEEYQAKGFNTRNLNGPKPGKTRPRYGQATSFRPGKQGKLQRERERKREMHDAAADRRATLTTTCKF